MSTELANRPTGGLAIASQINDMFGNEQPHMPIDAAPPQIAILREAVMFELPNGKKVEEFSGHIIYWHNACQYYETPFDQRKPEDSKLPTCFSSDGVRPDGGEEMQAGPCRACPLNQYGSDTKGGNGKACSNTIRLAVLMDGDVIPALLKAPPSSLGKKESLMKWLTYAPNEANKAGCGFAYQAIHVNFSLSKKDFSSGMSAAVLCLCTDKVLNPNNADDLKRLQEVAAITKSFKQSYLGKIVEIMASESDTPAAADDGGVAAGDDDEIPI